MLLSRVPAATCSSSSQGGATFGLTAPSSSRTRRALAELGGWRLEPTPPPRPSLQSFHLTPPTHTFRQSSCMCERVRWKVGGWGCRCKVTEAEALVARSPSWTCVLPCFQALPCKQGSLRFQGCKAAWLYRQPLTPTSTCNLYHRFKAWRIE